MLCSNSSSLGTTTPTGAACAPGDYGRQALSPVETEKRSGKRKSDSSGNGGFPCGAGTPGGGCRGAALPGPGCLGSARLGSARLRSPRGCHRAALGRVLGMSVIKGSFIRAGGGGEK